MDRLCRRLGSNPILLGSKLLRVPRRPNARLGPLRYKSAAAAAVPEEVHTTAAAPTTAPTETPGIVLRDYQEECIESVLEHLNQGHKRLGISLATGAGKTVIFTQLIGRIPPREGKYDKALILVHRRELVEQAARHCRLAYPDRKVEIEMGNTHASGDGDIIIASVKSIVSKDRLEKFNPDHFKLVLVDEAHHIVAQSYLTALTHFNLDTLSPKSPILVGVSATFARFDGLKLGSVIDHIVYHKDYMDMIDENWLSNAVFTTVRSEADLNKVKKDKFGDFALASLSQAVNTDRINDITVRAWLANAEGRKSTLVFCVDVAHTTELTMAFRRRGIDARFITAQTPKAVRGEQLQSFKNQEFPVLVNCGLFTEGTDIPNIDCVLLARPTRSRNLLVQMIGRGLRLFPGKKDCHIIDMVATLETGVISTPTLLGLHPDEVLQNQRLSDIKGKKQSETPSDRQQPSSEVPDSEVDFDDENIKLTFTKYDTIYDLINDLKSDKHIRSLSRYAWVRVDENRYILNETTGWLTIDKAPAEECEVAGEMWTVDYVQIYGLREVQKKYAKPRRVAVAADFEGCVRSADTFAATVFENRNISVRQAWRRQPATQPQLDRLNKAKIRSGKILASDLTRGQAADLITKLKHGGKKRFSKVMKTRQAAEIKARQFEELKRRTEVKVGPLQQ
ncbi:DEAD/DEAH box helicase [Aspergillus saccharolyticus JOP 1030-1]|uniref:DEAD/DEAH box helicase n=1 Tax=Aspergillus saccharolyticus JOP 1030-1 TaxID=1450539 RepID=A0A318ZN15_9EURO|nr:DEAD/DEAH box helicase [Aspergillus saccharolyticus JOP 1030-1]PYH48906.1 DEAD/DEAH box helicase [Aspergillus saccharolyticus JOP 1030-1]